MSTIPRIVIFTALAMMFLSAGPVLGREDEDVPVSCFLGTQGQYEEVGTIDVFNPSKNAVGLCNVIYWDCSSQCWACWIDRDGDEVCRDLSGRQFSR